MVRNRCSRRSLLAAAVGATSLAGCLQEGSCRTVHEGTAEVRRKGMEVYDADAEAGQRLYVRFRRVDGPRASLSVFDPSEEPLVNRENVDRFEEVIELTETGQYAVVTRNESSGDIGRWETTVAIYRGWCSDVY
ncbi:MAG: hypothetical protein U9O06_03120 [Euryarchaeota archaeon]|nr:hypothetical protein [Euryarchaeota archaeon]